MKTPALMLIVLAWIQAQGVTITVDGYQKYKLKAPDESEAIFTQIYIDGIGDGLHAGNAAMFAQVVTQFRPSPSQLKSTMLFCPPAKLALTTENYKAIIDAEVERRMKRTGGDPIKVKQLMQTPIGSLLAKGLADTFPCTQERIQELVDQMPEGTKK